MLRQSGSPDSMMRPELNRFLPQPRHETFPTHFTPYWQRHAGAGRTCCKTSTRYGRPSRVVRRNRAGVVVDSTAEWRKIPYLSRSAVNRPPRKHVCMQYMTPDDPRFTFILPRFSSISQNAAFNRRFLTLRSGGAVDTTLCSQ